MNKDTVRLNWLAKKIAEQPYGNPLVPMIQFTRWGAGVTIDVGRDMCLDASSLREAIDIAIKMEKIK